MQGKRGARGGFRKDLGYSVRSAWEANVGRVFALMVDKGIIAKVEYEPQTYNFNEWYKVGAMSYKPDFRLTFNDGSQTYYEVKGWATSRDFTQLKRYLKHYGDIPVVLICDDKRAIEPARKAGVVMTSYAAMEREWRKHIDEWE